MTASFDALVKKIHWEGNPYTGWPYDPSLIEPFGFVGWTGFFNEAILKYRPDVIIENGVLYGASTRYMAKGLKDNGIDGAVISVDTYLQEQVLWQIPEHRAKLRLKHGRSQAYEMFMTNNIAEGLQDYVVPLAMDSRGAARYLRDLGITAPVIYIDACHMRGDVYQDLELYWPLLRPGGVMIMDDYSRAAFPQLVDDVDLFAKNYGVTVDANLEVSKARIFKP